MNINKPMFAGNFIVEKKHLTRQQIGKLSKLPGEVQVNINDQNHLAVSTEKDDAKIAAYLRKNNIGHQWHGSVERIPKELQGC